MLYAARQKVFPIFLFVGVLVAVIAYAQQSFADEAHWQLVERSGQVAVIADGTVPVALTQGDSLLPGQRIETGADGRAMLRRGESTVVVAPSSVLIIPKGSGSGTRTRLLQKLGTILLKVEKRREEHFEVITPYLAAVVKGTRFTVTVDGEGAVVHVTEGIVEVTDRATDETVLLRAGQTAASERGAGYDMTDPRSLPSTLLEASYNPDGGPGDAEDGGEEENTALIEETLGDDPLDLAGTTDGLLTLVSTQTATLLDTATGTVAGVGGGALAATGSAASGASGLLGGALGAVGSAVSGAGGAVGGALGAVGSGLADTGGAVGGAVGGALGGAGAGVAGAGGAVGGALGSVGSVLGGLGGALSGGGGSGEED